MNQSPYNPYDDEKLHITENLQTNPLEEGEPFNDVIKHRDIIQGHQTPKRMEQYPKWYQNPKRIYATISLLVFFCFLIYQVIELIISMVSEK